MADMSYTNVSGVQMSLRLPDHTDNICISQLVTCNTGPVVTDSQRMFVISYIFYYLGQQTCMLYALCVYFICVYVYIYT